MVIADADEEALNSLHECLLHAGHSIVAEVADGVELIERCRAAEPDVVVTDVELKGVDGLAAAAEINGSQRIPIILTSAYLDDALIERANNCQVFGILAKPIRDRELAAMIVVTARRFREFQLVRASESCLQKALEDRKIIERAKGILMKKRQLNEHDAFHHLQQTARQHREKLVDVAKSILLTEAILDPHE